MTKQLIASVALSDVPYCADKLYSYRILPEMCGEVHSGMRVTVPFGRGNRHTEGFVMEISDHETDKPLKPIAEVLDMEPLLDSRLLQLIRWMKARYFCTYYDALHCILPSGIWIRYREEYFFASPQAKTEAEALTRSDAQREFLNLFSGKTRVEKSAINRALAHTCDKFIRELLEQGYLCYERVLNRQVRDKSVKMVSLAIPADDALAAMESRRKTAPVQYAAIEMLCAEGNLSTSELCYFTGVSTRALSTLEKSGLIRIAKQEILRVPTYETVDAKPITLNCEQQAAYDGLVSLLAAPQPKPALLYGVTASGKTQVYIRLIQKVLDDGKSALLLVPEIALTPQMMAKFTAYFGDRVAMMHSGLRLTERYDRWKQVARGEVQVVLGTRSAVFAPLDNLGLIIMDEEQEPTYHSENNPRYHARDIALQRCAQNNALLVLGSATPTVETMFFAQSGRYEVFTLRRRYNQQALPRVLIADMREELRSGNGGAVSTLLKEELRLNIERGEQSILFLNRRGNARMLLCGECGFVPECPRCSVPMTYHSANGRLMCHYCGHSETASDICPACGGRRKSVGVGTQKVEQELAELFPDVRVLRMDTDTVGAMHGHEALLEEFTKENVPILLGTQMVAKGLDFENVTLVGVLAADLSLYVDNYHAAERTFSLLSQVVGRAGRGGKEGRAVIQTYTPENDVICAAAKQDYESFYQSEIRTRKLRRYPPFDDMFTFTVSGFDESHVLQAAAALRDALRAALAKQEFLQYQPEVLGPVGAPIVKVNNRYRYRIYVVAPNCAPVRKLVSVYLLAFGMHKENRGLDIFVDCNALQ